VETYYLTHRDDFKMEDRVKLRRITLTKSSDPKDPNAEELAKEILQRLKEGASFTEMAAIYSQDLKESRESSWYRRSALRKEWAEAVSALKPGQWSGIVETSDECYLLIVDEMSTAHYKSLSDPYEEDSPRPLVREVIERNLLSEERGRLEKQWIDRLKKKTFVQIFY